VKMIVSYTGAAVYKDEAFQTRKALSFSSLNILTQKSSPKVRENQMACKNPRHLKCKVTRRWAILPRALVADNGFYQAQGVGEVGHVR